MTTTGVPWSKGGKGAGSRCSLVPLSCSTCPLWKPCLWSELSDPSEARRGEPVVSGPLSLEAFLYSWERRNKTLTHEEIHGNCSNISSLKGSVPVMTWLCVFPLALIFSSISFWGSVLRLITAASPLPLLPPLSLLLFLFLLVFMGFAETTY